jgi:hypothetical protein
MSYSKGSVAGSAAGTPDQIARLDRFPRPAIRTAPGQPAAARAAPRPMPLMRKVEVACQDLSGDVVEVSRLVPAIPVFEEAFSAFARGTLFQTLRGLQAVEDLWPGDSVKTVAHGYQALLWRGSTMIVPHAQGQDQAMGRLTRITADGLGIARPSHDLVLGPKARLSYRGPGIKALTGKDAALIPARDFVDGNNVIELTPATSVPVFHLGFAAHEIVIANGVEVESFHPGPAHALGLRQDLVELYLSCFPHMPDIPAFGLSTMPRLRLNDLDLFNVA